MSSLLAHAQVETGQGFPLRPVPASPEQLLARVQQLYRALTLATPAARPFLERDIRAYADRYRACTPQEPAHAW